MIRHVISCLGYFLVSLVAAVAMAAVACALHELKEWMMRFTEEQVLHMRSMYCSGAMTIEQLAVHHSCAASSVCAVVHGETYRHVGGPTCPKSR